jgi:hypothetical protein
MLLKNGKSYLTTKIFQFNHFLNHKERSDGFDIWIDSNVRILR